MVTLTSTNASEALPIPVALGGGRGAVGVVVDPGRGEVVSDDRARTARSA